MDADSGPYRGLEPFTEGEQSYFFGRKSDAALIAANVATSRVTILFGPPGVGKSSVISAGVIPLLRQDMPQDFPIVVFRKWQSPSFSVGLRSSVTAAFSSPTPDTLPPAFDELLAGLCVQTGREAVVVLDQFEEYCLYHPLGSPAAVFDAELARAINRKDVPVKFLLALREDSLSMLDRFQHRVPNLLASPLRLRRLTTAAARTAIEEPLKRFQQEAPEQTAPAAVEPALTDALVHEVRSGRLGFTYGGRGQAEELAAKDDADEIEAPFLQLVLVKLWQTERAKASVNLRLSTFRSLGGARVIVCGHLENSMAELEPSEAAACASFFERMVTPSGAKVACRVEDIVRWAERDDETVRRVLTKLVAAKILRYVPPPLGDMGGVRYEIFHDVLAPAILQWSEKQAARERHLELEREAEIQLRRANEEHARAMRLRYLVLGLLGVIALAVILARQLIRESDHLLQRNEELRHVSQQRTELSKKILASSRRGAVEQAIDKDPTLAMSLALASYDRSSHENDGLGRDDGFGQLLSRVVQVSTLVRRFDTKADRSNHVAWSPSHDLLATSGEAAEEARQERVSIWSVETGQEIQSLPHGPGVLGLAFYPPSVLADTLLTGDAEAYLRRWNATTGALEAEISSSGPVLALAIGRHGQVAEGQRDSTVRLRDLNLGLVRDLHCDLASAAVSKRERGVGSLAFSPSGALLAGVIEGLGLCLWNPSSEQSLMTLSGPITALAFGETDADLVIGRTDGGVELWSTNDRWASCRMRLHFQTQVGSVEALAVHGQEIAVAGKNPMASVWQTGGRSGDGVWQVATMPGHSGIVTDVAFNADGSSIATVDEDGVLRLWRASAGRPLHSFTRRWVSAALFLKEPGNLVIGTDSGVELVTTADDQPVHRLLSSWSFPWLSVDQSRLVVGISGSNVFSLYDLNTDAGLNSPVQLKCGASAWSYYGFGAGDSICAGNADTVEFCPVDDGRQHISLHVPNKAEHIDGCSVSPDGTAMLTYTGQAVRLYDLSNGMVTRQFNRQLGDFTFADYAPNGRYLVTLDTAGRLRNYDIAGSAPMTEVDAPSAEGFTFTPDGLRLVTWHSDGTAHVWRLPTLQSVGVIYASHAPLVSAFLSAAGDRLVVADESGTVSVHSLELIEPTYLVAEAKKAPHRALSSQECKEYFDDSGCKVSP